MQENEGVIVSPSPSSLPVIQTMLNKNKDLKLYYSISEVAEMLGVKESTLRFWEKEFSELSPKKAGRGIRQYAKEDIEQARLIYRLVKEQGLTIPGARQRLKSGKEEVVSQKEIVERLKAIRQELLEMRDALDGFTYQQVDDLQAGLNAQED